MRYALSGGCEQQMNIHLCRVGQEREAQGVRAALLDAVGEVGLLRALRAIQLPRVQIANLRGSRHDRSMLLIWLAS